MTFARFFIKIKPPELIFVYHTDSLDRLTLTRPIGLPPHAPVAQKVAEQCTLISSLVKRLFARVDWTERLRDDSSTTD